MLLAEIFKKISSSNFSFIKRLFLNGIQAARIKHILSKKYFRLRFSFSKMKAMLRTIPHETISIMAEKMLLYTDSRLSIRCGRMTRSRPGF